MYSFTVPGIGSGLKRIGRIPERWLLFISRSYPESKAKDLACGDARVSVEKQIYGNSHGNSPRDRPGFRRPAASGLHSLAARNRALLSPTQPRHRSDRVPIAVLGGDWLRLRHVV